MLAVPSLTFGGEATVSSAEVLPCFGISARVWGRLLDACKGVSGLTGEEEEAEGGDESEKPREDEDACPAWVF